MIHRILTPLKSNSFFLFGARGTGKTTFLKQFFAGQKTLWIDLLNAETEDRLSRHPQELREEIQSLPKQVKWVVIDEVQKIPKLLDLVHQQIEEKKIKFALTGSSARKLKRGQANLLAGRAFMNYLYPFTHVELKKKFSLEEILNWGSLPQVIQYKSHEEKSEYLKTYTLTYLKEEIVVEQIIRKLDPFRRFLEVAAQLNTEVINYSKISRDVGADVKSVQSYYEILSDTLLGFLLEPFHYSLRKRQSKAPKFYFFDQGVTRALSGRLTQRLVPKTYGYGKAFEHFLVVEVHRLNQYLKKDYRFSYLRTKDGAEIDLVIERPCLSTALIEIKSKEEVSTNDVRTLKRFAKDFPKFETFIWSLDPRAKTIDGIKVLPWQKGLSEIGLK